MSLGNAAIWDANEAFYVETPREMIEAGDYVNPTFNYEPRFNKPVLSYWIVAALYKIFGVSVAVQRFGIACGAILIIACAYSLASASEPISPKPRSGEGGRTSAALWAAVGLAAAPRLVMFARRIFIDVWITAFMAMTLTFFALSERHPEWRRTFLILMYVAMGLGVLTKGPVAIALPALAFGLYLLVRGELRRITTMMIPIGIVIVAVIVVPWYIALYREQGWTYIWSFLINENVERFTQGVGVRQPRPIWFYIPVVLSDSFPASVLLFAAAVAWKQRTQIETLLWCWIGTIVVFFSFSAGKQDLYIFAIVPAVAALGGIAIQRGLERQESRTWVTGTIAVTGALLAFAGALLVSLLNTARELYALDSALIVGVVALTGGIAACLLSVARRTTWAAVTLLATMVALNWTLILRVLPEFERYQPVPAFSRAIGDRLRSGDVVVQYRLALPSMVYYLRRHIEVVDRVESLVALANISTVYVVVAEPDYRALESDLRGPMCVVASGRTLSLKLRDVLRRKPPPVLLVVTNRCSP